jgi:uncharacterized membrane protein/plastocyanin
MLDSIYDWSLILVRWFHIVAAISWVGESVFFMWLDRSLVKLKNPENKGHAGELWMIHGGGFYRVEKLLMGHIAVPRVLHWFKWEAFSTWISGMVLMALIYYTGGGTFLLDDSVSQISFYQGLAISIGSVFGSWFLYDALWETKIVSEGLVGHVLTIILLIVLAYFLSQTLSGRAAYIHMAAIMGTWMVGNVLMRILPRQTKMVEATSNGEVVNPDWGINAKNRSTHNTYLTLPVIFIMISNHFPETYGHDLNWLLLLIICLGGAFVRQFFIIRESNYLKAKLFLIPALVTLALAFKMTLEINQQETVIIKKETTVKLNDKSKVNTAIDNNSLVQNDKFNRTITGTVKFEGTLPPYQKLRLPKACAKQHSGNVILNNVIINKGFLKNVMIRVKSGLEGINFPNKIPKTEVVFDQKACIYFPRVAMAQVGQVIRFKNSDPLFHNVKAITKKNKKFNKAMPKKDSSFTKIFQNEELHIQAKCSLHPWMGAHLAILDHPYFSVSSQTGVFIINNLPTGKFIIEAWHEVFGTVEAEVDLTENPTQDLQIVFK